MLTRKGYESLLKRIFESGGLTADMEEDLQKLKADYDEREGILSKYGEEYDNEVDEYTYTEKQPQTTVIDDYKQKYDDLKKRYMERFFGGTSETKEEFSDIMTETMEDVERDGEPQTFDDLLENLEEEKEN